MALTKNDILTKLKEIKPVLSYEFSVRSIGFWSKSNIFRKKNEDSDKKNL